MTWKMYGETLAASDLSTTNIRCPIKFNSNVLVKGIRTCVILYGNPTYTNLRMKIYDNNFLTNEPSLIKSTSLNAFNPNDLLETHPYGVKFIYFEFTPFGVDRNDLYHAVLSADSYAPTDNSFIAWRNFWPDPVYTENIALESVPFYNAPILITSVIGSPN